MNWTDDDTKLTDKESAYYIAGVECGGEAERERILAILRAVSPNAGYDCNLLLEELACAIEGEVKPKPTSVGDMVRLAEIKAAADGKPRRR